MTVLIPDPIVNSARLRSEQLALVCGSRTLSFRELDDRANRVAAAFLSAGLNSGDRVALLARNNIEYFEIQLATVRSGLVLVPLNFRLSAAELSPVAEDANAALLLYTDEFSALASAGSVAARWKVGGDDDEYARRLSAATPIRPDDFIDPEATASILYTSGTTGRPKGVVVSNAAVHTRVGINVFEMHVRPGDVLVQTMPLFHIAINMPQAFLWAGGSAVIMQSFAPDVALELVARHGATHLSLAPTMLSAILESVRADDPLLAEVRRRLRIVYYGGSAMPTQVLRRGMELLGCDFIQGYGSTENGTVCSLRAEDHVVGSPRLASAGQETPGQSARVVREDGAPAAVGEFGELLTRSAALASGYWQLPELTAERFAGGWFRTGDVAYRDEDGYVYIVDRTDDMIVTGGENVYPREVEEVLYTHPDIVEAAVIGVPDERWVQRIHAVIAVRADATVTLADIDELCRPQLAGYKIPRSLELRSELPKGAAGKILRRQLRNP